MKLGTTISNWATPAAGWLGMDCYDPLTGDLKPWSRCAQTRDRLDSAKTPSEFASAIFDRFWSNKTEGDNMAEEETKTKKYLIVVLVETARLSDIDTKAVEAASKGEVIAVNPQQERPATQMGGGRMAMPAQQVTRGAQITGGT